MSQNLPEYLNDLRLKYYHEMETALKIAGRAVLEMETDNILSLSSAYYEAKGKVSLLDDILVKVQ